jgi:hypothetical protein
MNEDQDSVFSACNSAVGVFLVQPIIAKQILPWFGGSASVWNTCLFFFQFLLLLGYVYAHALTRWATIGQQAFIHVGLLALSLVSLPVIASQAWKSGEGEPALRILLLLSTTVGLPYFLLATTSPLLQAWYFRLRATPYRLFALVECGIPGRPFDVSFYPRAEAYDDHAGQALVSRVRGFCDHLCGGGNPKRR